MKAFVEARRLVKVYRDGTRAVVGVSFEAGRGVTALMGPNGSGKTTTLSMVAGALRPSSGRVLVCGYDVWGRGWYEARSRIGYAPQNMPFVERLTVLENMVWHGMLRGLSISEARRRGLWLLEEVGLSEARGKMVRQLSGGMRRRLAIAAALVGDPEVLVLDEPGSGLDPAARDAVWSMVSRLASSRAVLVSTHSALEAERYADTVLVMHRGRVVAQGAPGELVRSYAPLPRVVLEGSIPPAAAEAAARHGRVLEASPGRLVVAVEEPDEALPALVEAVVASGGRVRRASSEKSGLRDVYLVLTGEAMGA